MLDVDELKKVLISSGIFVKDTSKNFICKCPYCGDRHKGGGHEHGHLYVSKNEKVPLIHCFYCNHSSTINKLLLDLTGDIHKDIVDVEYRNKEYVQKKTADLNYKVPDLNMSDFPLKTLYMKRRTFSKVDVDCIPNLIFDIKEFFRLNGLKIDDFLNPWEQQYYQDCAVGFLSKRNTLLYLRAISNDVPIKFKKVMLKSEISGLDYYSIDNYVRTNTIVLAEGNFDILGCYGLNTLELRDKARCYNAGCTFSYEELLKSVCIDYSIYRPDVIVLSDCDKNRWNYKNFLKNCEPFMNSCNIYYNCLGKDFGDYPQKAVRLF